MPATTESIHFDVKSTPGWTLPLARIGGLPIAVIDRAGSAKLMIDAALARRGGARPLVFTSANGQVLSQCARYPRVRDLFLAADLIHADGMPLVFASRLFCRTALPERVATTDLFHDVARIAPAHGARFFLLGASEGIAEQAAQRVRGLYPELELCGHAGGYLRRRGDEARIVERINKARPDILWLGLGAPRELEFALRHRDSLCGVGLIKTSGGLFDFLSGRNSRAPHWMQRAGLEWAYRTFLEPRRLAGRYLLTNPHAALLLLTRTGRTRGLAAQQRGIIR
ncbi:MAG TPA: WecB/TagA/CpsF family glycosyltransferase [Xanthobacteraceae bacterium]|nr:WecB/TagA/CpsF family glycosyltransferase [Xanthobacteraceae bacterium]